MKYGQFLLHGQTGNNIGNLFVYISFKWIQETGKVTNIMLKRSQLQNENHNLHNIGSHMIFH